MSVAFVGALSSPRRPDGVVRRLATIRIRGSRPLWGELARFALPVGIALTLTFAYGRIDQILVFQIAGTDAAGIYGAMYRILNTLTFLPTAVFTTLFPVLSSAEPDRMRRLLQLAMEYLAMVSLPIFAFVLVAAEPVIRLLFGPEFVQRSGRAQGPDGGLRDRSASATWRGRWSSCCGFSGCFVRYALIALVFNVGLNLHLRAEVRLHRGRMDHTRHGVARGNTSSARRLPDDRDDAQAGQVHPHRRRRAVMGLAVWGLTRPGRRSPCWWSRQQSPTRHCCSSCAPYSVGARRIAPARGAGIASRRHEKLARVRATLLLLKIYFMNHLVNRVPLSPSANAPTPRLAFNSRTLPPE